MRYYYKRPGDWLWRQLDTDSIEAAVRGHRAGLDWRYRVEGDSTNHTLGELIEMERVAGEHERHTTAVDPSFTAPDATWGYITIVLCCAALAFLIIVPSQQPHSGTKLWLSGMVLVWMSYGVHLITAAKAWKRRHPPHRPNQTLERTGSRRDV
jgi:hypothetical protein